MNTIANRDERENNLPMLEKQGQSRYPENLEMMVWLCFIAKRKTGPPAIDYKPKDRRI